MRACRWKHRFCCYRNSGGFLSLSEVVHPCEFGECAGLPDAFECDTDMKEFLLGYDETEFEQMKSMAYIATSNVTVLVETS